MHMNYAKEKQGNKQTRTIADFGINKWVLLKQLLVLYHSNVKVHKKHGLRRATLCKEKLKLRTIRMKVPIEIIRFQFQDELTILVSLFGENTLKGQCSPKPRLNNPTKKLCVNDHMNVITSQFTLEEQNDYYNLPLECRHLDLNTDKYGVDFMFCNGNLRITTRYDRVQCSFDEYEKIFGCQEPRRSPRSTIDDGLCSEREENQRSILIIKII